MEVPFRLADELKAADLQDLLHAVVPEEFRAQQDADKTHQQEGGVLQPGLPLQQRNAVAGHHSQRDDSQRHPNVNEHLAVTREGHSGDHVVEAQGQIEKRDHRDRRAIAVLVGVDHFPFIRSGVFQPGKVRAHQPDQIQRADQHQGVVPHDVSGREKSDDAEAVGSRVTNGHRRLALFLVEMGGHRGDGQRIVHRKKSFDQDERHDHRDTVFDGLPGISSGEEVVDHRAGILAACRQVSSGKSRRRNNFARRVRRRTDRCPASSFSRFPLILVLFLVLISGPLGGD